MCAERRLRSDRSKEGRIPFHPSVLRPVGIKVSRVRGAETALRPCCVGVSVHRPPWEEEDGKQSAMCRCLRASSTAFRPHPRVALGPRSQGDSRHVCVCVCVRARARARARVGEGDRGTEGGRER